MKRLVLGLGLACICAGAVGGACCTQGGKGEVSVADALGSGGSSPPPGDGDSGLAPDLEKQEPPKDSAAEPPPPKPPADGPTASGDRPRPVASVQSVTFTITNGSGQDRFVVTRGHVCQPYAVARLVSGSPQPLRLEGSSVVLPSDATRATCEGTSPGMDYLAALHRIRPGESFTITWDARAFVEQQVTLPCLQDPTASRPAIVGALQPVTPGSYRVTVGVQSSIPNGGADLRLPRSCTPVAGAPDDFTCTSLPGGLPMAVDQLCHSNAPVTAEFVIPEHGDLSVPMPLN
jgi:hypothetical protein